jgi:hypothetical protein
MPLQRRSVAAATADTSQGPIVRARCGRIEVLPVIDV